VTPLEIPVASLVHPICGEAAGSISILLPVNGFTYTLVNDNNPTDTQTIISDGTPLSTVFTNVAPGTYSITVTSLQGCTVTLTGQVIQLASPLIISCPPALVLECGADITTLQTGVPIVNSDCSNLTITFEDSDLTGGCSAMTGTFTRTFTVSDSFGNTEFCEQIITIEDTTAPQISEDLFQDIFTSCEAIPEAVYPAFIDDCDTNLSIVFTETNLAGECESKYTIERTWTATDSCGNQSSINQLIHVACPIIAYNGLSLNNDGNNDVLRLKGIECYPENNVKIFNRWGVLVFNKNNYNNEGNAFRGISEGRLTVNQSDKLPAGTYFYVIDYEFTAENAPKRMQQTGYLYITND
jgi:gliding motility-associated-like protein